MRVWIAVWTGSTVISRAIAAWIAARPVIRLLVVVLVAGFVKGLPVTTGIVLSWAGAWTALAVILGLRLPDPTKPVGTQPAHTPAADGQDQPDTPTGITREQLVRALHQIGTPHAHTSALADHLKASTDAVREALAEAGIPTQGGVRMKGRKVAVSPGVRQQDFPPLPSPDEGSPQEGPLTCNNNGNNNRGFETVPDEKRPHRTLVRWLTPTK
ncbi:MAG: hypothetical protein K0R62_6314 [Nonomuraea muscovyensis]|nr:hypothetical protein [Nonomuraea muscovyensis]